MKLCDVMMPVLMFVFTGNRDREVIPAQDPVVPPDEPQRVDSEHGLVSAESDAVRNAVPIDVGNDAGTIETRGCN